MLSGDPLDSVAQPDLEAWTLATLPRALAYARSLVFDHGTAEDVVHDCYVRLLKKADSYDLLRDGTKLLFRAITNACVDKNHRERRFSSLNIWIEGVGEGASTGGVSSGLDPVDVAAGRELEDALAESLRALPINQRSVVELKALGYSLEEIGESLRVSAGNAAVLLHRARKVLALRLARFLEPEPDE